MTIERIHHVAYRCVDAYATARWYEQHLGMQLVLAISEESVPSTGEAHPYMHIFLDAGGGNVLAFFELPQSPPMQRDPNTPAWVQHIALKVDSLDTLERTRSSLQAAGIEVLGIIDHTLFQSIYFFDPNGHRLELAFDCATAEQRARLDAVKWAMLEEWRHTRRPPRHAAWLHKEAPHDKA